MKYLLQDWIDRQRADSLRKRARKAYSRGNTEAAHSYWIEAEKLLERRPKRERPR